MNAYLTQILRHFRERADAVFSEVVQEGSTCTILWSDLESGCRKVAACLQEACEANSNGDKPVVLVFLPHGTSLFPAFLGAMLGGFVPSIMPCPSSRQDKDLYWKSHQALLQQIQPAAIITNVSMVTQMQASGLDTGSTALLLDIDIDARNLEPHGSSTMAPEFVEQPSAAIALLQHSSGTTGLKKGVALSFDAIQRHAQSYGQSLQVDSEDVIVSWLPLYHDMGLIACFVTPAWLAIPTVQLSAFEWLNRPQQLFRLIERYRGTLCWLPNFAFEHMVNTLGRHAGKFDLSRMRAFISCSEPCKAATFDRFAMAFAAASLKPEALKCCYAMAETVFGVTQVPASGTSRRLALDARYLGQGDRIVEAASGDGVVEVIDCGVALPGMRVSIVDSDRHAVTDGTVGEIAIAGEFLFSGYYKDPERTRRVLGEGVYYSNDLGFMQDGRLYVLGRMDDLIIVNGRNLFAHQIEALVSEIHGVKPGRAACLPLADEKVGSDVLIILAERDTSKSIDDNRIIHAVMARVQAEIDVVPRAIELVDPGTLIKTSSGKMSRKENLVLYLAMHEQVPLKLAS